MNLENDTEGEFPELIFGLVGAIGTDLDQVQDCLDECLRTVGYEPILISVAERLKELKRTDDTELPQITEKSSTDYYDQAIKKGNYVRESLDDQRLQ